MIWGTGVWQDSPTSAGQGVFIISFQHLLLSNCVGSSQGPIDPLTRNYRLRGLYLHHPSDQIISLETPPL